MAAAGIASRAAGAEISPKPKQRPANKEIENKNIFLATSDTKSQKSLDERLADMLRAARELQRLRSLVVMHEGKTVLAESLNGPSVDEAVNIKSVSKSINAAYVLSRPFVAEPGDKPFARSGFKLSSVG